MGAALDTAPVARSTRATLRRALAMLLLPASILPVLLAGPALVRAPETLGRQLWADVQRMQSGSRSR
jgi:hypothetical protein